MGDKTAWTEEPMPVSDRPPSPPDRQLVGLMGRQILWVTVNGLVLGVAWGVVLVLFRPNDAPSIMGSAVPLILLGGVAGGLGGLLVGLVTSLVQVLVAIAAPVERHVRLYRLVLPVVAAALGLVIARYTLAAGFYWVMVARMDDPGPDSNFLWDVGWNQEVFPTLSLFLRIVGIPTLFAAMGTWWATRRAAAWYARFRVEESRRPRVYK